MADVKSLFKKKGKKKNTLNTSAIPSSGQHIDAEALSSKNAEKADDGWADKEEKKKVVVSSGKGLASLQSLTTETAAIAGEADKTASSSSTSSESGPIKTGWVVKTEVEAETVKEEVVVETKPFQARRPPTGALKPNTECSAQFPTLGAAAAVTEKAPGSVSSPNKASGGSSYLQSGGFNSSSSSSPMGGESSSMGGRPRLALKPRTAPLPEPPVVAASPTKPVVQAETATAREETPTSTEGRDERPISKADSASSWRGSPSAVPPPAASTQSAPMFGDRFGDRAGNDREASASWRERRELPPGPSPESSSRRDDVRREPMGESPADKVSSWRGQPTSLPSSTMRSPSEREPTSSWRERGGERASPASNSPADSSSSWSRGKSSPSQESGGIRFGGGSSGERPKLALKPRSVKE